MNEKLNYAGLPDPKKIFQIPNTLKGMHFFKVMGGGFPAQKSDIFRGLWTLKNSDGSKTVYIPRASIQDLKKVSEGKNEVSFEASFKDGKTLVASCLKTSFDALYAETKTGFQAGDTASILLPAPIKRSFRQETFRLLGLIAALPFIIAFSVWFGAFIMPDMKISSQSTTGANVEKTYADACRNAIRTSANFPSTIDFHTFTDYKLTTIGEITVITQGFSAKNGFGVEQSYTARCTFDGAGNLTFKLMDK